MYMWCKEGIVAYLPTYHFITTQCVDTWQMAPRGKNNVAMWQYNVTMWQLSYGATC
jgi:hypothetical protein